MSTKRAVREDQHGTQTGYTYGCRCLPCRDAYRDYKADGEHQVSSANLERIYAALEREADFDGLATTTGTRLGELTGLTQVAASAGLRVLEKNGRIRIRGRAGGGPGHGGRVRVIELVDWT